MTFQRMNVVVDVECSSRNLKSLEHVYRYRNLAACASSTLTWTSPRFA